MPKVNPKILEWAREKARLSPEEAILKLGFQDAKDFKALDRLSALENGAIEPSRTILVKMARQYHRPLVTFYMSSPPKQGKRGQDFRTLPKGYSPKSDAILDVLIRDIWARQNMIRVVLEDEEEVKSLSFIASFKMSDGVLAVLDSIQNILQFDLSSFYNESSPERAFALLRSAVEKVGIFVLLLSNLGSYHTSIQSEIFRGFALADNIAPFVIINEQDSKAAWSFTLIHELTHLWLGQTGVSGAFSERELEKFCNDVASEFLLPEEKFKTLTIDKAMGFEEIKNYISEFATSLNLSSSMVAYKLFRRSLISKKLWDELKNAYREYWYLSKQRKTQKSESGPSYYVVHRHHIGDALIGLVQRMMSSGAIPTNKAGKILGMKAKNVHKLFNVA